MILRPATVADAAAITEVFVAAFSAALPHVRQPHTAEQVECWYAEQVLPRGIGTVAVSAAEVVGYAVVDGSELEQLYVAPAAQRAGIGSALLAHARTLSPDGLQLWTFQANAGARAFYAAHGFTLVELTDGSRNEEREPDARYAWAP